MYRAPTSVRLYVFNSAHYLVNQCLMTANTGCGSKVNITTTWSVLVHPEGAVLFDTGVSKSAVGQSLGEQEMDIPLMYPGQEVTSQLTRIGLTPNDVRYVVHTHLHQDHVGGSIDVPGATFICQRTEYEYALEPDIPSMVPEYPLDQIGIGELRYETIEGDVDLFGDDIVQIIGTPGHTPGHQSVLVRLPESGPIILTGDAIWTETCLEELALPSIIWSPPEYVRSRRRLVALRESLGARWFFSHDPETFGKLGWVEGKPYA